MSAVREQGDLTVIEPRSADAVHRLGELWTHRRLVAYFGRRGIERLYARTVLGRSWLLIRPGMDLVARALIFGGILAVPSAGIPYVVFLAVGTTIWMAIERGLLWSTRSIEMQRRLVSQVYFPRLTLWMSSVFPTLVEMLLYLLFAAGFIAAFSIADGTLYLNTSAELLLVVPSVLLALGITLGIGLWTSVWGARTRDMRFTIRYITGFWYFLTPVIIPLSAVPERYRPIMEWNPLTPIVEMFKLAIVGRGTVQPGPLLLCIGVIAALWASGLVFFSRSESAALDRL